ncbi:hypothetical protein GCM10027034_05190 [Ramlibacter solisilvae]|uniref:Nitrate reductase n=1 Tax=Ramlibacter tataouinensis TaxID=94132 RepID=A0A127JYQ5_9BURK|nr:periplasmic nitrate reductase, NapE protein [Ramlibacter tataouinensis]AMO25044.1 nitrate reductase [Ramlibacter tataouinensis]
MNSPEPFEEPPHTKAQELRSFLFLSVVMAPAIAGIIIAGYGFLVWMYQLFAGPPGPAGG